ncbi:MAG: hypothetical protein EP343_31870 [Deltaproteobacteria bacterium]|nr:MAG: hypothetical protein EP343_31870 [Deltaproteobacteria bacterium]
MKHTIVLERGETGHSITYLIDDMTVTVQTPEPGKSEAVREEMFLFSSEEEALTVAQQWIETRLREPDLTLSQGVLWWK